MDTPGKELYKRNKVAGNNPKPPFPRKKAATGGSDAKSAYVRRKQVVKNLRRRLVSTDK